jgi:hypothetical protein
MAGVRSGGLGGAHDDADADGLNWELSPRQSEGYGRAIDAAVARDLAVTATARRPDAPARGRARATRPTPVRPTPSTDARPDGSTSSRSR